MAPTRVAIIYDNKIRPETTGVYCQRALQQLAEVHFFTPDQLPQIPRRGFDLYLNIDDGLHYHFPSDLRPCAWWVIDTHMDLQWALRRSPEFDAVFAAQRDGSEHLRRAGMAATWLPLACDPQIHRPWPVENQWDLCFVGNLAAGPRSELIGLLQKRFPRMFVGQRYFDDYAKTCSASSIGFNRSVRNDVNMRVFETLGCGTLLMTNDLRDNGQEELFQSDRHLITYKDADELTDKLRFYLRFEPARKRIAQAGHAVAVERHTYLHRMRVILETMARKTSKVSAAATPDSPMVQITPATPVAVQRPQKSPSYFQHPRPEVVALIPPTAQRVLDIGCGVGRLGELLKKRQAVEVTGLELQPAAAKLARQLLDHVLEQNVEDPSIDFPAGHFDAVVCADVLEHLREPAPVLAKIRRWLSPTGCLVASIPNVRHYSIVAGLLAGNWTYESAGLLDEDHVRFFTRREIEKLFYRQGFSITELQAKPGPGHAEWVASGRPGVVKAGTLSIGGLTPEVAEEFFTYQYLVVAQPTRRIPPGQAAPAAAIALQAFRTRFLWPTVKPTVPVPTNHMGWCNDAAKKLFRQELAQPTTLIVELGAWLGLSTRFMADLAPQAHIITIDHFQGSPEHHTRAEWAACLPTLYESFLVLNWDYRQRITPLRMKTLDGLQAIADAGLEPDLIFIDAEHSYDAVRAELELSGRLFPKARLIGDDYHDAGVRRAVDEFGKQHSLRVEAVGTGLPTWRIVPNELPRPLTKAAPEESCGLTSIVILTFNQLGFTKECVDSICLRTDEPYELIFVDNGSTDGTPEYLATLDHVTVIANKENRGFPAAVNQGMAVARGQQVLLLNNDTVVSTGWLRRMLEALDSGPKIGLVGPSSNHVSGEQIVAVSYSDMSQMDGFAWDWGKRFAGQREMTDRLVGFCLLIRRELIDEIGGMDERFGIGCFEDDDYSRRAIRAGWQAVIARDSFVHHYGGRTFEGLGVDYGALLKENRRLYNEKWLEREQPAKPDQPAIVVRPKPEPVDPTPVSAAPAGFRIDRAPAGGLVLVQKQTRLKVSLCMIVRDNAQTIEACLESIKPWVDEMIVVDTGSKDDTALRAERMGARVFHFPWPDSFSVARNESVRHARGEWVFWMDSDDTISAENGRKLRDIVESNPDPKILGFVMQVHCPGSGDLGKLNLTIVDHVKLFRNLPDLRFTQRIHEQILPAIRETGGEVAWTDIFVLHSGYDHSPEGQERKKERDLHLLNLEWQEQPTHPFTLFNLGMTYADIGQHAEAIEYLKQSIHYSGENDSHLRKTYALLVYSQSRLGQMAAAVETCEQGLLRFAGDLELRFRRAILLHELGRLPEAVTAYLDILSNAGSRHFSSVDPAMRGFKARQNLAIVYADLGDWAAAEEQWRQITVEVPEYPPGWRGLGDVYLRRGRIAEAENLVRRLEQNPSMTADVHMLRSRLAEVRGLKDLAHREILLALQLAGTDVDIHRIACRFLFEFGDWPTARQSLQQVIHHDPQDAAAYLNLGSVLMQLGQSEQAIQMFEQSRRLRPDYPATFRQLGQAYLDVGKLAQARDTLMSLLQIFPQDTEARALLANLK